MEENSKTVDLLIKAGIGAMLAVVLGLNLYWAHQERMKAKTDQMEELMPVLRELAEGVNRIAETYSPE